ncbi:hypothetical protein [Falsirhodobacter algicola]|uniref:Uncharacterized protein n=1 Tax=Falsirhodobacter algicola TaxID=2692330 RepID=A0A8J8MSX3_9RHOB|nr:hypothetical protein [Falsirhodobacter algicola]QUS35887.1 hypothetical protein GR316_06195 [Falsirhodobacter algicola]
MAEHDDRDFGPLGRPGSGPAPEVLGGAAALFWILLVLGWWLSRPDGEGPGLLMVILLLAPPLGLVALLVSALRTLRDLRAETARLRTALDSAGAAPRATTRPEAMRTPVQPPVLRPEEQPSLAFEEPEDVSELTIEDFIRALDFPDSEEDEAGIDALRHALADPAAAKLIRAAQDVLMLLAEDGVFTDELAPSGLRVDLWRRFAAGERGADLAAVGAIHDRAALSAIMGRLREDQIFRDAVHHFLRSFDRSLQAFAEFATDAEIGALADSRTGRAFMLTARSAGVFN